MSKQIDNGNGFKTPEGQQLGKFDAPLVRSVLHECDTSIGLMFNLFSRMPEANQYHDTPAATYGAPAVHEATSSQPVSHGAYPTAANAISEPTSIAGESERATVFSAQAQPQDEVARKMDELRQEAYNKMNEAYENA